MADYVLSEKAKSDLREIADYTQKRWSDIQAERYIRMLFSEFSSLADKPLAGRCYDHCRVGLRGLSCGKHVIMYRVLSRSKVRIVRVLHEMMDFHRHLK